MTTNSSPTPPFLLETQRLRLRSFDTADLEAFATYRNDEVVASYQGWNTPYTLEQAQSFLEEMRKISPGTQGVWYQLAIERKSDAVLLGDCAFKLSSDGRQAELGCTLAQAHWGHGYATEAVRRLIAYLFGDLGLHRLYANCDVENQAAVRTLEQLGLRREAHFVENLWFKGRWSSEYWYALLADDWGQSLVEHDQSEL